tara:strand:- start:89 stop:487 length:399 start_codon:yes stop_codon:yes gene_type:complete
MAIDYFEDFTKPFDWFFECTILGEPASKANQRKLVRFGNRPAFIKSDKARAYEKTFREQCPVLDPLVTDDVVLACHIYYASRRPDLDESLIMDLLQDHVIKNDRQIKAKVVLHGLDKGNPRTDIKVARLEKS